MLVIDLKLQAEEALGVARENDLSGQASDGDVIGGVNVSKDSVLAGGDLVRKLDGLSDGENTLLDGALEVNVLDLLTQVRLGADKANEAVLDLEENVCALLNVLLDGAGSLDDELLASLRRVGREVYAVDCDDVLIVGLGAELQRRVAGDLEVIINDDGLVSLNQDTGTGRCETGGEEGDDSCGEPHRG